MAYVVAEISCSPNGEESYPVPTTIRICRVFGSAEEAASEFDQDVFYKAESEYAGQNVYYVLWKLDEPLNLDRSRVQENRTSNCGMWLPQSDRVFGSTELTVELVPPEKLQARAKQRAAAEREAKRQEAKRTGRRPATSNYERGATSDPSGAGGGDGGDGGGGAGMRGSAAIAGARYARGHSGTPWNRFM